MDTEREIIVVKYGSSSVANEKGMDHKRLARYAKNLAEMHKKYELVVVSSGSVAVGKSIWQEHKREKGILTAHSLAMLGSSGASSAWQRALGKQRIVAAQLLVTHREVDDPMEGRSLVRALHENIDRGIVTVANENDALNDEELAKLSYGGDNDGLAAHIATKVGARALCLMTDTEGLFAISIMVPSVGANEAEWDRARSYCDTRSPFQNQGEGRGSMLSKVNAAIQCASEGIDAYIANASSDIQQVLLNHTGTHFVANK